MGVSVGTADPLYGFCSGGRPVYSTSKGVTKLVVRAGSEGTAATVDDGVDADASTAVLAPSSLRVPTVVTELVVGTGSDGGGAP